MKSNEISIFSVVRDLIQNFWVILLAAVAAWIGVASIYHLIYVPEYTANTVMAVYAKGENSGSLSNLTVTTQMAEVFEEVFTSNVLYEKIAEELHVDQVDGVIETSVIPETNLINIQVAADTPREAYMILDSALNHYESVSDYLFSNASLRVLKEPYVPYYPSNSTNIRQYQKLGALLALVVMVGVITLFSVMRPTIKTKESGKSNLDGKIRGMIPYEWKEKTWKGIIKKGKGKSLLISSPVVSMQFAEAYRKITTRVGHHMQRLGMKVLLVSSVAENEGKSSVAANLSLAFAEKGKKVLLLDVDLKKPAQYKIFDYPDTQKSSLREYLEGKCSLEDILYFDEKHGIYMVFIDKAVSISEKQMADQAIGHLIEHFEQEMDYIILDSAPMAVTSDTERIMKYADSVLMVVRQDWSDYRVINDQADVVRKTKKDFSGFVLNAFHKEPNFSGESKYGYGYRGGGNGR